MNLRLKNKKTLTIITFLSIGFLIIISLFFICIQTVWNQYDYKMLDYFYRQAVKHNFGPKASFEPQIIYLTITDVSYNYFGKNCLDRNDMAKINNALSKLDPEAVAYDIIFARKSVDKADIQFTKSLDSLDSVYLPIAFSLSEDKVKFKWKTGQAYEQLRSDCFSNLIEKGTSKPYYAKQAFMQYNDFAKVAMGSGSINALADSDSIYRHLPMLVKVDDVYYPTLSFLLFLDWTQVPFDKITVEWGKKITVPSTKDNALDKDVIIPIDQKGRVFVPFVNSFGNDFKSMTVHAFLKYFSDKNLRGNLSDLFEGNFVIIADVSTGTSDIGYTPLETNTILVNLHASLLNGLLTNTFYTSWSFTHVVCIIYFICFLLIISSCLKSPLFLYGTGFVIIFGLIILTWLEFIHFYLFPIITVEAVSLLFFIVLIITLEIATSKDRLFIKNTFARYVPKKVVTELLNNPQLIKLGGEERIVTVFFSDIVNFTAVSEKLAPNILIKLLNEYFTEMTNIILQQEGIIDKYLGDAIMAEFGVPIPNSSHADQAVTAALKMQYRLTELRKKWLKNNLPQLHCRIGINTNNMIVGNIGSDKIFDYTVIGDAVNLASRLEGANRRYGTSIIISENTWKMLTPDKFKSRILDFVSVKGKTEAIKIYAVYGFQKEYLKGYQKNQNDKYHEIYHKAFNLYLAGDLLNAKNGFVQALALQHKDPASMRLIKRIEGLEHESIPDNWNGSVSITTK